MFLLMFTQGTLLFVLGADNLCGRLMEKINSSNNVKQALAHMPLILVCMEVFSIYYCIK